MFFITILFAYWLSVVAEWQEVFNIFRNLGRIILPIFWALYPFYAKYTLIYDPIARKTIIGLPPYAGTFAHKNLAGGFFSICLLIEIIGILDREQKRSAWSYLAAAALAISLAATGAVNALMCAALTIGLIPAFKLARTDTRAATFYTTIAFSGGVIVVLLASQILELLGRDVGFTGRGFLVNAWPMFFLRHPTFGYGYGEFFSNNPLAPAVELMYLQPWHSFFNFESSYLQIAIDFGGLGLFVYMTLILKTLMSSLTIASKKQTFSSVMPVCIIVYIIISSIVDTYLTLQNCFVPFLMFYIFFIGLKGQIGGARRQASPGPNFSARRQGAAVGPAQAGNTPSVAAERRVAIT
jgi:O-antigen ligase